MKIAEALIERADIQKRLSQLSVRLQNNALVQDGEKPEEEPSELLAELDRLVRRLCELVAQINLTNARTEVDGMSVTEMLSLRDALSKKAEILRNFLNVASSKAMRNRGSEIVIKSTVSVSEIQKNVDSISKQLREIDTKIQGINWTTDLIE